MKSILVTGFDPFGGELTNPSFEAVKLLEDEINGVRIIKKEIPTEFFNSKDVLLKLIEEFHPDVVLNVGQAGGRESISIERQAFNLMEASIPDNAGFQPHGEKINPNGKEKLFSTVPIEEMVNDLNKNGVPAYISESAGRYVCNYVMYSMLSENKKSNFISCFIHVPYSKEQALNKKEGTPFMKISEMADALTICIKTIIRNI